MNDAAAITIGNRLAPTRFIAFVALFAAVGGGVWWQQRDWPAATMIGFDVAALVFLVSCLPLLRRTDVAMMRRHARENDANRALLLVITGAVMFAVLAAIAAELVGSIRLSGPLSALVVGTLILAWLFSNSIYALHYAHLFYIADKAGGVDFPGTKQPNYEDFVYFAFTLGMTFQTSDVAISDRRIRRIVTWHCFAAFVFNLGVLAFTINVLGG